MKIVKKIGNTKEEAEAMVRACKYAPLGDRSNAGIRGDWGINVAEYTTKEKYREYLDMYNDEIVIAPMIETQQAIDNKKNKEESSIDEPVGRTRRRRSAVS